MGRFDYFVTELKCPKCGKISKADQRTDIQNKIQDEPDLMSLGIGTKLDLDSDILDCGYFTYQGPPYKDRKTFTLIEAWQCPSCHEPYNFARIVVSESIIISFENVELTEDIIKKTDFITESAGGFGWHIEPGIVKKVKLDRGENQKPKGR